MKVVGIDPGLKGGIAFYDGETLVVYPTPLVVEHFIKKGKKATRNLMNLEQLQTYFREHKPTIGFLEKVTARPGQGVTSMFRFGMNFGEFRSALTFSGIPFAEIRPQVWKAEFKLNAEKNASLELARELFPDNAPKDFKLKKQDGMAEASLIAKFGFDNPISFFDNGPNR